MTSRRLSLRLAAAAAALTVTVLAACAPGQTTSGIDPETASEEDKRGGELIYLDAERTTSFQLTGHSYWQTSAVVNHLVDRLVFRNPKTLAVEPWLAESWEESEDGLVYTFHLREGVTHSDGSALDAANVKRNLEWQAEGEPAAGIPSNSWFPELKSVEADDGAGSVTVTLTEPFAPFLPVLSNPKAGIVSNAVIDMPREEQSLVTNLIGSGPFVAESEIPGKETVLVRREGYAWAPQSAENQGETYIEKLTVIPVEEDSVRLGTLTSGQGDALRYVLPSEEQNLKDNGFQVVGVQSPGAANFLEMRFGAPYIDDINVRRALLYGIDREAIHQELYTDSWTVATGALSPGTLGYEDLSEEFAFDPDHSEDLLDEAGWNELNGDGIRTKDGEELELRIYVDVYDNTSKPLYELIQHQLTQIGIKLTILETDYASYPAVTDEDTEAGLRRNGWPAEDPYTLTVSYAQDQGDRFRLDGSDEKLEELLTTHTLIVDEQERAETIQELHRYLIEQAYVIPLLDDSQVFVLAPHVHGFSQTRSYPWFYNVWVSER